MFDGTVFNTAIGVVLIFLLLSLLITALNEMTATVLALRAKNLEMGIRNLLRDDSARQNIGGIARAYWDIAANWERKPIVTSDPVPDEPPLPDARGMVAEILDDHSDGMATRLYRHGLIDGLSREGSLPSYIPPRRFALALFDLLMRQAEAEREKSAAAFTFQEIGETLEQVADPRLREALLAVLRESETYFDEQKTATTNFLEKVESWYNDGMDRVSGWYKRQVLKFTVLFALCLVVGTNADTFKIVRVIYNDSVLRNSLSAVADKTATQTTVESRSLASVQQELQSLNVVSPLDYSSETKANWQRYGAQFWRWNGYTFGQLLLKLLGFATTILAIALGAPFWFDILKKAISIRGTGKLTPEVPGDPARS